MRYGDPDSDLGATASSGLAVTYTSQTPSVCTIVAGQLHVVAAGDCTIASAVFGSSFNVNPSSDSSLAVSVAASGGCSVAAAGGGYTVTMTSGTTACVLTASQAGNDNYLAATNVVKTVNALKKAQTISFTAPASAVFGSSFNVNPSSDSSLAVSVAASGGCSVAAAAGGGYTVTMTSGTTACVLTASQAGNDNYLAATNVVKTVNALKKAQTISFTAPASAVFGSSFNVNPSSDSSLAVSVAASGGCSAAAAAGGGYTVTMTSGTTACVLTASQAGNDNYLAATNVVKTVNAEKKAQTITFVQPSSPAVFGSSFNVNPSSDSSLAVSVAPSGGCSAAAAAGGGYTVTMTSGTTACVLTASQAGNDNYLAASPVERTVAASKAPTVTTLTITPSPQQYSDKVNLSVVISPAVAGSVQFQKSTNGGSSYTDIGTSVAAAAGTASLLDQLITDAPSATNVKFKAVFSPTASSNYAGSNDVKVLEVTQENASAEYSGPSLTFTPSTSSSTANILLQAVITDAADGSRGEIKYATVDFINMTNPSGAPLCSVSYADRAVAGKQFLIDSATATAATVGCTAAFTVSGDSDTWNIGIRVGGYYMRTATMGDAALTVSLPWATQFITGGGYLKLGVNTAGTFGGDVDSKNNFGFNVKYNNKGTNLQGRVNVIVRKGGKIFQIKGNNLGSLGVSYCKVTATGTTCSAAPQAPCTFNASPSCPIKATFQTQANMTDVTNPLAPVSVPNGSGGTLQMTMTDFGEPGSNGPAGPDTMAITMTGKDGSLLYATNWQGGKAVEQLLTGGNLVVH